MARQNRGRHGGHPSRADRGPQRKSRPSSPMSREIRGALTTSRRGMLNNPAWSAYYLWKDGEVVPDHAARCPRTMKALAEAPLTEVKGRSPAVLFSLLRPGARIPPHNGLRQHAPDLSPAADRPGIVRLSRRQRHPRAWSKARRGCSTTRSSTRPGTAATGRA